MKSAIELAEKWPRSGNLPYQVTAGTGSLLAVLSMVRGERPSDLVARFFNSMGAESAGQWFNTEIPPFITTGSAAAEYWLLAGVAALIAWMVVAPVYHEIRERMPPGAHAVWLVGNRASATFWLLLLAALQQGPYTALLQDPFGTATTLILWALGFAIAVVILALLASGLRPVHPARPGSWSLVYLAKHIGIAFVMALFAISIVPAGIPAVIVLWLSEWKSQIYQDTRNDRIQRQIETMPTGAWDAQSAHKPIHE